MSQKRWLLFMLLTFGAFVIGACSKPNDAPTLLGSWKVEREEGHPVFLHFEEEEVTAHFDDDIVGETTTYRVEEEGETFHLYIVEPTTGKEELFTNGVFEDANTILSDHPTMEWKRIDSIEQAMEKEKRKQERRAAREAEKVERSADEREEQEETNEAQEETEADVPVAEEVPLPAPAPPVPEREEPVHVDPLATQRQAAVALQQRVQQEIGASAPNGAYGQYYGEWDALLNDVWQQLQASLSPDAFQTLTNEQVHWIAEKERILRENEAVASARAWASDEVTRMTEQRTFYLLDQLR